MKNSLQPIRVLIADDHKLMRASVRALLGKFPKVEVVGEAASGREALNLVKAHRPEIVLMDIAMAEGNGLEATARVTKESPNTRVIILSMHGNEEYVWRAIKAGAAGYLLKKAATSELEQAVREVAGGGIYFSQEIASRLLKKHSLREVTSQKSPFERLTDRQREILQLIAEGQNVKVIAQLLKVSPKTVEYHRTRLMSSLNIHDIPGLVRLALQAGLIAL
jgi:DNA-binding NarL/FixJ family response regulator